MTIREYVRENKEDLAKLPTNRAMADVVAKALKCSKRSAEKIVALEIAPKAPAVQSKDAGVTFSLKGVAVLSKRPQDVMKGRLHGLKPGVGYEIDDLAEKWGVSPDTLRSHAKKHKALAYVEASPGEYVACVVHPDEMKGRTL